MVTFIAHSVCDLDDWAFVGKSIEPLRRFFPWRLRRFPQLKPHHFSLYEQRTSAVAALARHEA
jgi:hypothetical protein